MNLPALHRQHSLRARLLLIIALAFALVSGVTYHRMAAERDERIEDARNRVRQTAESIVDQQSRVIARADQALSNLAPTMRDLGKNPNCSAQLAAKAREYPEFWNIGLAMVNGNVICHAWPFPRPLNIADRAYFQEALQSPRTVISGPLVGRVTDIPTLIFARALRDESGRVEAVYYVALSLSWMRNAFTKSRLPDGSRLALVDSAGQIIARHPDPEGAVGQSINGTPGFKDLLAAGGEGVSEYVSSFDGVRRIIAVSTFANTVAGPILLYVGIPKSVVTAGIERDFAIDFMLLLGLLAMIAVLGWYGSNRFLLRPIAALCDAARRLGEGDFTAPAAPTKIREVRALQSALVDSAEKLRSAFVERQRVEDALLASEARLRLALESADLGTWDLDLPSGRIFRSLRHDQIFGYPELQSRWSLAITLEHIHPEDRQKVTDANARTENARMSVEVRVREPQGGIRWIALLGRFYFDAAGRPVRIVGVVADITEDKRAEQALQAAKDEAERANNAKSRFLAAASHDLRQPLSALALYVGVLKYKVGAKHADLANSIQSCVSSLSELLTDLLDMSKLDAGVVKPNITDFAITEVLEKLIAQYANEAQLKGIALHHRASDFVARSDALLLTRALGNLLSNAVRYTERGGVLVGCRRREGEMWVEIWDTGIGIPADKTAEIFEEFRQLESDARNHGSGLGLAIVAKIGALLGVKVRVCSRLGKGSMFALQLPQGQARIAAPEEAQAPYGEAIRIALVEDNARVLEAMLCSLENAGHQVVAAVSGEALLARLDGLAPDIVISDYRLEGKETGFDVIAAVRKAFGESLPAIIVTGDTDPKIIGSMAQRGILIQYKPIDIDALQLCIAQVTTHWSGHADAAVSFAP